MDGGDIGVCGLTPGGSVYCWIPASANSMLAAPGGGPFVEVAVGDYHACAVTAKGDDSCWFPIPLYTDGPFDFGQAEPGFGGPLGVSSAGMEQVFGKREV